MAKKITTTIAAIMAFFASYSPLAYSSYTTPTSITYKINNPPVIRGFKNPQEGKDPIIYIHAFPGSEIQIPWLEVTDYDGDKVISNLESIVDLEGNQVPIDQHVQERSFSFEEPGFYSVTFSATDGENVTKKKVYVNVSNLEDVLDEDQLRLYQDVQKHKGQLVDLGKKTLIGYLNLLALADAETDLKHTKRVKTKDGKTVTVVNTSNKDAVGWFQVTPEGIEGIIKKAKDVKVILSTVFDDYKRLADIDLTNYTTDLEKINPDDYGWNEEKYQLLVKAEGRRPVNTRERILNVHVPTYIAMMNIFPDLKIDRSKISDKAYNAKVGAAKLLTNYLEMSSLQAIKNGKGYQWVYKPRSHFDKHPNLRAFDFQDVIASYNAGVGALKRAYIKALKDNKYDPATKLVPETKTHRKRWNDYKKKLIKLEQNLRSHDYARNYMPKPRDLL